jgi:hypothetical protein
MQPQWDHASGADKPREFAFTTSDFNTLRRLV